MSLTADKHICIIAQCVACMWRMGQQHDAIKNTTTPNKIRNHKTASIYQVLYTQMHMVAY